MAASHALVKSSLSFLGTAWIAPNFPVYVESWERRDGGVSVMSPSSSSSKTISGTDRKGMISFLSITMLLHAVFWSKIVPTGSCGCVAVVKDVFLSRSYWSNLGRFCGC